jgi:hypothetical protein
MDRLFTAKHAPGIVDWDRLHAGMCWNIMRELMVQYGVEVAGAGSEAAAMMGEDNYGWAADRARECSEAHEG